MVHTEELQRIRRVIDETKEDLCEELKHMPEGRLSIKVRGDKTYYFHHLEKSGNRKKTRDIGITNEPETVMTLVRKQYVSKAVRKIENDIKVLDNAIKNYEPFDEVTLMGDFIAKHPELAEGVHYGHVSDESWAENYQKPKDFYDKEHKHTSLKGDKMLSKNELYISSRLEHYNIPYRYEPSNIHPDVKRVPDFMIRRPRDGKIIFWEHLGLTDDARYMWGNEIKFSEYMNVDIVPWDNLIITYDDRDGGIDAKIIEAMIQGWLL